MLGVESGIISIDINITGDYIRKMVDVYIAGKEYAQEWRVDELQYYSTFV